MTLKYDRALGERFFGFISASEALQRFLGAPGALPIAHSPRVTLDTQFRRGNVVSVYAGLTKVLDIKFQGDDILLATAAKPYRQQEPADRLGIYGRFKLSEIDAKLAAWEDGLGAVKVEARWWHKEGAWQSWLSRRASLGVPMPWVVIDREAELEELTGEDKDWLKGVQRSIAEAAVADPALQARRGPIGKSRGGGVDFLGVTPDGNLALIEAKHGSDEQGVYCTPIQVGGYAALWSHAFQGKGAQENLVNPINRLINQKRNLGLLPKSTPNLKPSPEVEVEPFVFIGDPRPKSQVWRRQCLLGRVQAAAGKACEPAKAIRFFTADATTYRLREVTSEVRELRSVDF